MVSIIPGQHHLMGLLGEDTQDPFLDPFRVVQFRNCARSYEVYLAKLVHDAVAKITRSPLLYRDTSFVDLLVDLNKTAYGLPYHVVHYGTLLPGHKWTRRAQGCFRATQTRNPFIKLQHALANLGYTLLDVSVAGSAPIIRLYYRSPPTHAELAAHAAAAVSRFRSQPSAFWHGLHQFPMSFYTVPCPDLDNIGCFY